MRNSELQRQKTREANKGNKHSLGYKHTEAAKKKIGEASKGNKYRLGKYPSKETRIKMGNSHRGNKSPHWKGGINPINDTIRHSIEMRLWREAVLSRDNWICQKCGNRGGELRAHHIFNFADHPELRFAIDNGITLCVEHHKEFHRRYGVKGNNQEQISKFNYVKIKKNKKKDNEASEA